MAKSETYQKQLEQWKIVHKHSPLDSRVIPALKKLPERLRLIGFAIFDRDKKGEEVNYYALRKKDEKKIEELKKWQETAKLEIDKLSATDRKKIFGTLGKDLADAIELTWQNTKVTPYDAGYFKSPFRAPKNPEITLSSRISWLKQFASATADYDDAILTPAWLAAWAKHAFEYNSDSASPLLIAVMNGKGKPADEVFDILYKTVTREHPHGVMADFVIESLLGANRPEGWEIIEKTLLAAQRQEGLRQMILSRADSAHPEAFRRLLRIIVDQGLIRFSSVARSVDVWLKLLWDSASTKILTENVESILKLMESGTEHKKALASRDAESVYRALWVTAHRDALEAIAEAKKLLKNASDEIRYVAVWMLMQLGIKQAYAAKAQCIDDENLQIATLAGLDLHGISAENEVIEHMNALDYFDDNHEESGKANIHPKDNFEKLERLFLRLPEKPVTLKAIVWPWTERKVKQSDLCEHLLESLGDRPPTRMLPYLKGLKSWQQTDVVARLSKQKKWDSLTRTALLDLVGHSSSDVRKAALEAIDNQALTDAEFLKLEDLLSRTATDLRNGIVSKILKLEDRKALSSSARLLMSSDSKQRLAGLEILRQLADANRCRSDCQKAALDYSASRKKITTEEEIQLKEIAASEKNVWSLENALGYMDPKKLTKATQPAKKKIQLITPAAIECLKSLDELIHENRAVPVRYKNWREWREELLGEVGYGLPTFDLSKPLEKQLSTFPLWELWEKWNKNRPAKLRDKDGLELLRSLAALKLADEYDYESIKDFCKKPEKKKIAAAVLGYVDRIKLKYEHTVEDILEWVFFSSIPKNALEYLLDCAENSAANVTETMLKEMVRKKPTRQDQLDDDDDDDDDVDDWRNEEVFKVWPELLSQFIGRSRAKLTSAQYERSFALERFWDQPIAGCSRQSVPFMSLLEAFKRKLVNFDDVVEAVLGLKQSGYSAYCDLTNLTARQPSKEIKKALAEVQGLSEFVTNVRNTLLDIELNRGEKATVTSKATLAVNCFWGIDTLFKILQALNGKFKRLNGWNPDVKSSRPATLTELVKACYPTATESAQDFVKKAKQAMTAGFITEDQMLELAFLAPQWSKFVGELLNWDGFSEGLYWFLAHMNTWMTDATEAAVTAEGIETDDEDENEADVDADDDDDDDDIKPEKLSAWERLILERTPLNTWERNGGAVDVEWFYRTFATLGEKRWKRMAECAKLASNASQAKKAQLLADVLLGKMTRKELIDGIKKRNLKENVRFLGLLPLAEGTKRTADLLERYDVLVGYKKYARGLSSLTKPEAMRALEIGMSNLARLAGYADPLRLEWALEAESIKDLNKGPVSVTKEGVTVALRLDEDGKPELTVQRGDKYLKSVPAPIKKKHAAIAELTERATELRKKSSRIKQSLENAMCRGDAIDAAELLQLMNHAILAPHLKRTVLIGDGIAGYPDKDGKVLRNHQGKLEPIKKGESLRIAHPSDLLKLGDWDKWQHECFLHERVQSFKQIFRELYVPTKAEQKATQSTRFAGHQIGPKQAMALWNGRGWNTQDEVIKVFHDRSMIARVTFQDDIGTAAEIEGLTIAGVEFINRENYKPLKLSDVPPTLFSEIMRDIDLVVSVAHRGEVDPEASESTVEMRTTLVRETCQLLGLKNVKLKAGRAIIDGYYGEYSVHLGSGGIQRMPGGALAIIAVQAQHRGRLFLPFADDDPKSAEILSKVLLLARDEEIMDPMILDQLGAPVKKRPATVQESPKATTDITKSSNKGSGTKPDKSSLADNIANMTGGKRRFEFSEGKSNKFWEIELSGNSVITSWGRIGTAGQSLTKQCASEQKAKELYNKLIEEKTGKGYSEV